MHVRNFVNISRLTGICATQNLNKSTLDNSPPPLLNLKSLLRLQGQIIDVKCKKIAINRPFWNFFQPLLNFSKNYLLVTCITDLEMIQRSAQVYRKPHSSYPVFFIFGMHVRNFVNISRLTGICATQNLNKSTLDNSPPPLLNLKSLLRLQGQIIDVKCKKIAINQPFWNFFQPLLNFSKNYLLVTCITDLEMIHEKFFTQGRIIDVRGEKTQFYFIFGHYWTFQVIAPKRSNFWRKMRKIAINQPF